MTLGADDYAYVCWFMKDRAAIVLDSTKQYLVESRLGPIAKEKGLASVGDLVRKLRAEPLSDLPALVVDALTTNETLFFRDTHPFETLRKSLIPDLVKARGGGRPPRIWCAACSSGQEPYSIAMIVSEHFPDLVKAGMRVTATDLSETMVKRARDGTYNQFEVNRGLPVTMLVKHFDSLSGKWRVKEVVRKIVDFRELNLVGAWPLLGRFDIVFMRYVLIYFDVATKKTILNRVRSVLAPDGVLLVGGSETLTGIDSFAPSKIGNTVCYRPV